MVATLLFENYYAGIVADLEVIINSNQDLKEQFEKGFLAQDRNSPWYRGSTDDFYVFFKEWLVFNPRLKTSREYIDKFVSYYTLPNHMGSIKEAAKAIRDPRFSSWLKLFVEARGKYLDSPDSRYIVNEWARESEINIGLYEIPPNGFNSFNEFFSRKLKQGVRPIYGEADPLALVSPADCQVWEDSGWLSSRGNVEVKEDKYNLDELIGDSKVSKKYKNGKAAVCFLMLDNYHRFHSPVDGKITYKKEMDGLYFGAKGFVDYFHERRRSVYEIQTKNGKHIAVSSIGIGTISSVSLTQSVGDDVNKGDEIGSFSYGGSALVLLFEPGMLDGFVFDKSEHPFRYRMTKVLMGQSLGKLR